MRSEDASVTVIKSPETAAAALKGTRRALLAALSEPDSAAGLGRRLGIPRQRLNYHLKALEECGLVECVEERRKGNCTERVLRATARSFVISPDALGIVGSTLDAAEDRLSASYVVAVASRTITEVSSLDSRARAQEKRIATLAIDTEIRFPSADSRAAFARELSDLVTALVARYHDANAADGRRFRLVAFAHPRPDSPASSTPDKE
jgi:DNA-binding transcriptional ArsR family regulator